MIHETPIVHYDHTLWGVGHSHLGIITMYSIYQYCRFAKLECRYCYSRNASHQSYHIL